MYAAWQQAQLSLSRGGLGFRSLSHHTSAAFISSLCSSGFGVHSSHHLSEAVEIFNSLVSQQDSVSVEPSSKLDDHDFNLLFNTSSVADKAHYLLFVSLSPPPPPPPPVLHCGFPLRAMAWPGYIRGLPMCTVPWQCT